MTPTIWRPSPATDRDLIPAATSSDHFGPGGDGGRVDTASAIWTTIPAADDQHPGHGLIRDALDSGARTLACLFGFKVK